MIAATESVRTTIFGMDAVLVEQPSGELVPYLCAEVEPSNSERIAYVIRKVSGESYRPALSLVAGWVCTCGDWRWNMARRRAKPAGMPCKHITAVLALRAEIAVSGQPNTEGAN